MTQPREVIVELRRDEQVLWQSNAVLSPERVLIESVPVPPGTRPQQLSLRVCDATDARVLVSFTPLPAERSPLPAPATASRAPRAIASNEELYLTGLHLEQYRHAIYAPEPYYEEALRRDAGDSRCNNAMGLLLYRRGKFADAEKYFRRAIERLTLHNPNPYDGEPYYNLGLSLRMQARYAEAFDAFYKAVWNAEWQDAAYFELSRLAARGGDLAQALELASDALRRNGAHHQTKHLQIALLRRLDRSEEALSATASALDADSTNFGALWERGLLVGDDTFAQCARDNPEAYVAVALDYLHAGLFDEAITLLEQSPRDDAMRVYFIAYSYLQRGDAARAHERFRQAAALPPDYCFPHRLESVLALQSAMTLNLLDARAPYYLGNFWYA
ncbi:MAG: tetratricopeptide repeat protein, partial [Chloroflexi bacterium]|nr:tetratricopeptide repeat protein [Chloroflexota bacterium]